MSNRFAVTAKGRMQPLRRLSCLALALAPLVASADVDWTVDAGLAHTDNAALTDTDTQGDTLASVGGSVAWSEQSRRLTGDLRAAGSFQSYLDDTFDDDFVGEATGRFVLSLAPERILWTLEDNFGQVATDQFAPVTPENRQNVNTLSTGPDVLLRLGSQSALRLAGRYGDNRYESSGLIDSTSLEATAAFERRTSPTGLVSLVASHARHEYDGPGLADYKHQSAYALWQSSTPRQTLDISVGANRVQLADGSETSPLLRVGLERRVTQSLTISLDMGTEYQNTAQQFSAQMEGDNAALPTVGLAADPAQVRQASLSLAFERSRTRLSLGGNYSERDFTGSNDLDEDEWGFQAEASRRIRPELEGYVRYRLERRAYDNPLSPNHKERVAETGIDWRLGRTLYLAAAYQFRKSDSVDSVFRYSNNIVSMQLSYRQVD